MMDLPKLEGQELSYAAFLHAILTMDVELAQALIGKINPNAVDFKFPTPWKLMRPECRGSHLLHEAVTYSCHNNGNGNRLEIVFMLLDAGANPNNLSVSGYSALHNAATVNNAPACRLLVERGAHINQQSVTGYTPLQTASIYKGTDSTAALILAGADFSLPNQHGENAYDYAVRKKHDGAVNLLKSARLKEEAHVILSEIGAEKAFQREAHRRSNIEQYLSGKEMKSSLDLSQRSEFAQAHQASISAFLQSWDDKSYAVTFNPRFTVTKINSKENQKVQPDAPIKTETNLCGAHSTRGKFVF